MRNRFYPLLLLEVSYALIYASIDHFEIGYSVTLENICHSEENRFQLMLGTSVAQCVKECGARPHCQALTFRSRINMCELFSTTKADQLNGGDCLYIEAKEIAIIKSPCRPDCKYGEVCENTDQGRGQCNIKECVNVTVPEHGTILGNQRKVGSKIRYKCDHGYTDKNTTGATTAECLQTGAWSATAKCVKKIIAPTIGKGCQSGGDCVETSGICIERKCFCNRFYHYDSTMEDCVRVCQSMSNEFEEFVGFAIREYNDESQGLNTYDSTDDCKKECVEENDCLSIDVEKQKNGRVKCWRGVVTREMILDADPQELEDRGDGWLLFTRKCHLA